MKILWLYVCLHTQYWSITEVWVFLISSVQIACFNVVKCHFLKIRRWLLYTQYVYQMQPDGLSSVYEVSGHSHVTPFGQRKRPEPQGTRRGALVVLSTLTTRLLREVQEVASRLGLRDSACPWEETSWNLSTSNAWLDSQVTMGPQQIGGSRDWGAQKTFPLTVMCFHSSLTFLHWIRPPP